MSGKESIIQNIISDAEKNASSIYNQATAEKDTMLATLNSDLNNKYKQQIEAAKVAADELIKRRLTLADLDERKTILAAKQKVIEQVYALALNKILNMTDHIYREFMENIMLKEAEDGDLVIVAERDQKRLHSVWLDAIAKKRGIHLSFSGDTVPSRGGLILRGKKYDKNLTLEAMVAALKARTDSKVAKRLFS